jgi:hypothetical protein
MACQKGFVDCVVCSKGKREAGCGVTHPPLPDLIGDSLRDRRFERIGHNLHVRYKDEACYSSAEKGCRMPKIDIIFCSLI